MSFDRVSDEYAEKSLTQKNAAKKLTGLLGLRGSESVLDVGCGPGHITAMLAVMSTGKVLGTDVSEAMLEEARLSYPDIEFQRVAAEDLDYEGEFDAVFCNSALLPVAREGDMGSGPTSGDRSCPCPLEEPVVLSSRRRCLPEIVRASRISYGTPFDRPRGLRAIRR